MFSFSFLFSAPVMAPVCIAAATDVVIDTSLNTTLSFDPMDLSTTAAAAMPQGSKRKLNELYESMGESPRKYKKVKHPGPNGTKAYHKHESRLIADHHLSTSECHEQASALCKEAALKSLFFQCKPNSYTFDFGLSSNTQSKSRAHDDTMYLFRGNGGTFPVEYLSFICVPSLALSPAPVPAASPGPVLAPSPGPVLAAPLLAPSPPVTIQDTSMDVVEMPELPLSHPSRLGKSMLRKKDRIDAAAYDMRRSLNDSLDDSKKIRKPAAKSTKLEKPKGVSKTKKMKKMKKTKKTKETKKIKVEITVRKPVMHGPFIIDDSDDEEEQEKKSTSRPVIDDTAAPAPTPGLSFSLPIHQGPPPPQPAPTLSTSSSVTITTSATAAPTTTPTTATPLIDPAAAAAANICQQFGTPAFFSALDNLIDDNEIASMFNIL